MAKDKETPSEAKEYTPEEMAEMRKKTEEFYDEQIVFLEKQFKFEDLKAKIEEAKLRKMHAMMQMAHLMNPYEEEEEEEEELPVKSQKDTKPRTLKTE